MELSDAINEIDATLTSHDLLRYDAEDGPCNDCGADEGQACDAGCCVKAHTDAWITILTALNKVRD